jgi:ankyrin repeat protein
MLRVSWGIFQLAVGSAQTSKTREKVKALLKDNPNLVFSKDNNGDTPLHAALR